MQKWNSQIMFPNDTGYTARVIGATFGPSNSSGNPMITLEYEFVSPEIIEVAGKQYSIAGVKTKKYYVTGVVNDPAGTEEARDRVKEQLLTRFEIDSVDWDNIDTTKFLSKVVLVHANSDMEEQRKTPTLTQIEEAKKKGVRPEGDVLKHPITGKDMIFYKPNVREVFGLAPTGHVSMPY